MKNIINAIKKYMNNYNAIQSEKIRSHGSSFTNAELFARSLHMEAALN